MRHISCPSSLLLLVRVAGFTHQELHLLEGTTASARVREAVREFLQNYSWEYRAVLIPLIEAGIERGEIHPVDALEGLKVREEAPAAAPASIMRCALSAPGIYSLRTIFGHLLLVKIVLVAGMIGLSPAHDFFLGRASATWANGYIKPRLPALEPASAKQALQRLRCWTVLIAQLTFVLGGLVILLAASLQSF